MNLTNIEICILKNINKDYVEIEKISEMTNQNLDSVREQLKL
jgi:hypothetical protein